MHYYLVNQDHGRTRFNVEYKIDTDGSVHFDKNATFVKDTYNNQFPDLKAIGILSLIFEYNDVDGIILFESHQPVFTNKYGTIAEDNLSEIKEGIISTLKNAYCLDSIREIKDEDLSELRLESKKEKLSFKPFSIN